MVICGREKLSVKWCLFILCTTLFADDAMTSSPYPNIPVVNINTGTPDIYTANEAYVGVGYNIFKGNPDLASWSHQADDPGLLVTKNILYIDQGNTPTQLVIRRYGCQINHDFNLIYNPKTYQDRLRLFVQGGQQFSGGQFAFTLSSDYNALYHQTELLHNVFQEYTTMCNVGDARYKMFSAIDQDFPLSVDFAASLCSLPETYSQYTYMNFLETWGTHVVTEVIYGKRATNRYRIKLSEYFNYLIEHVRDDISEGGPLMGFRTSLKVDLDSFKYRSEFKEPIGALHQGFSSSASNFYINNKLVLTPLDSIIGKISTAFWQNFATIAICVNKDPSAIQLWATNIGRAVSEYPSYNNAIAPKENDLEIPLTWPNGTYSLQNTVTGCPGESSWFEGTRHEEMERQDPDSSWSSHNHFGGMLTHSEFDLKFCTKLQNAPTGFEMDWPRGDYCIYKRGACPIGFQSGLVRIDDENTNNGNTHTGVLPDGIFDANTTFYYCCRSDGLYLNPVWLPNTKPFYLFKYKTECQKVEGMTERREFLNWDDDDSTQGGHHSGSYPALSTGGYAQKIYYCYYAPISQILPGSVIGK